MAPPVDPYRTLGLGRDATLDQVKRAYRRLAKANHPDTAGEAAVPRFLAIKAAYEAIAGPDATDPTRGRNAAPPRRAWDADPGRADATRRAYGSRARGPRPGARPGPRPASDPGSEPGASPPPPPPGADGPERPPNLATLGSTTYDGTEGQPFEPDWGGASWYGTTSGTYWTLNPKEYADPRKHGPEYQARARRARRSDVNAADGPAPEAVAQSTESQEVDAQDAEPATAEAAAGPASSAEASRAAAAAADAADDADAAADADGDVPPPAADPTHTTASWWDATAGAAADPAVLSDDAGSDVAPASDDLRERFLDSGRHGVVGRVGFAILGWAPVAIGISALAGQLTGCARAGASCSAADAPIASFAQIAILAILLLVPLLGRLAAMAALVVLAVAIPGSLAVSALGAEAATGPLRVAFAITLVAAWLGGLALAGVRESRRPVRPVS